MKNLLPRVYKSIIVSVPSTGNLDNRIEKEPEFGSGIQIGALKRAATFSKRKGYDN